MTIHLVGVDPLNPSGKPSPTQLWNLGVDGVRMVYRNDQRYFDYFDLMKRRGFYIQQVVASESIPVIRLDPPDMWVLGNEPDVEGDSSWTMSPNEYRWFLETLTEQIGQVDPFTPIATAGLASGNVDWFGFELPKVLACVQYVNVHYPMTEDVLVDYLRLGKKLICGEWCYAGRKVTAEQVVEWQKVLDKYCKVTSWFCWSNGMVPTMGLVSPSGRKNKAWWNYHAALLETKGR